MTDQQTTDRHRAGSGRQINRRMRRLMSRQMNRLMQGAPGKAGALLFALAPTFAPALALTFALTADPASAEQVALGDGFAGAFSTAGPAEAPQPVDLGLRMSPGPSLNLYGAPGLVDMPSAEMLPDGQFVTSASWFAGVGRYSLQFQALPWVTAAFRYNSIVNRDADQLLFGFETYYDRSFDVRFRLLQEGRYRPALAVGLQDFAGTGIYAGEYVVATKSLDLNQLRGGPGGQLKLTAGLGWGRLGSSGSIGSYGDRGNFQSGDTGGELSTDQWFRGDYAPFAGIEWNRGKWGLKAEYSSDAYRVETRNAEAFERKSSLNFGAEYQVSDRLRLGGYYLYGSEFGLSAQLQLNPRYPVTAETSPAPRPLLPRSQWAQDPALWTETWVDRPAARSTLRDALAKALRQEGLILESLTLRARSAELRYRNTRYRSDARAMGRAARALAAYMPPSVESFRIVPSRDGIGLSAWELRRSDLEALEFAPEGGDAIWAVSQVTGAGPTPADAELAEDLYPAFATSVAPYSSPSYFDPSVPLRLDLGVAFNASYRPAPGWRFAGSIRQRIVGNVDGGRPSNSRIQRVRTDAREYAQFGTTLEQLYGERRWQMGRNLYGRATLGYLERMYGGVSGEILWKPVDSPLGLGVELNYVRQRDFDQRLGFRDYSVATGHASAYLELPRNYLLQVDAGRYLAGDVGSTVTLTREFNNGWRIGGFFTVTDLSAEDFGEGSFDKGIRFSIPLGWLVGKPSRNNYGLTIRPVQRDGGARLDVPGRLYGEIRKTHQKSLSAQRARIWE